ncbi:hypothetical protein ZEAMMB73_Zm00001d035559 [Zea mays]|uniref:Uncharacterized protein n=1 Tax=Zea mays TaxID=4577 RepID=A0A1D6LH77_MAIZE|nr:hypothetical protein ZEAMMB73_Zm00001d035559 [Zea mays]
MENPAPSIVVPPIAAPVSANFSRLAFRNLYIRRTGPDSLTVRASAAVDSIEFTYTDRGGQRRAAGRWGGLGGNLRTIDLGDAEDVREVSGTYGTFEGATTLTSFRILTSSRTWGPWGVENGTRFCITAPVGSSIVGFYGRATSRLVAALGVYLRRL